MSIVKLIVVPFAFCMMLSIAQDIGKYDDMWLNSACTNASFSYADQFHGPGRLCHCI